MTRFPKLGSTLATGLLITIATASFSTSATGLGDRRHQAATTNYCQPTTPLNLGGLRFRPYGIYNASANPIYITCSLPMDSRADHATVPDEANPGTNLNTGPMLWMDFKSSAATAQTIECTVSGGSRGVPAAGVTDSKSIAAGAFLEFDFPDLDRASELGAIGVTCLLPPKVEWSQLYLTEYDAGDAL